MNDGGPAFPQSGGTGNMEDWKHGMSLRDWFAGMAMQGLIHDIDNEVIGLSGIALLCKRAYIIADEMLIKRELK